MSGLTLDTGALIAFERNDRRVAAIILRALQARIQLAVPAGVVAQTWRDGTRQARLARLLGSDLIEIDILGTPLTEESAAFSRRTSRGAPASTVDPPQGRCGIKSVVPEGERNGSRSTVRW